MSKPSETPANPRAEELKRRIEAYIETNHSAIVEDMRRILTFETVSGGKTDEARAAWTRGIHEGFEWIGGRARDLGLEYRNLEDIACVVEQPGAAGSVGALLHLDVVPPGEGWTHPPFSGALDNGVIYGRGCEDDKGPIVQCLHALAALKTLGRPFRKTVRLIIGSAEETGVWPDMKYYLEREAPPDLSIVPDAMFPIVNGGASSCSRAPTPRRISRPAAGLFDWSFVERTPTAACRTKATTRRATRRRFWRVCRNSPGRARSSRGFSPPRWRMIWAEGWESRNRTRSSARPRRTWAC
ncbi:MAG: M20/M25/M40 family metallo-hydrolase [Candidatus Sumerlaeota bacterium]|nr:M20/M25/M40 family metallo-hydrolase [Candidatus Sumerlaeota bacterium]